MYKGRGVFAVDPELKDDVLRSSEIVDLRAIDFNFNFLWRNTVCFYISVAVYVRSIDLIVGNKSCVDFVP